MTTEPLSIGPFREWGRYELALPPLVQRALVRNCPKALSISPTADPDRVQVKCGRLVGSVALPEVHLLIKPKIDLDSLFHLLEPQGRALGLEGTSFGYDTHTDLVPAFATFVAKAIERATGRGVLRAYRQEEERLLTLRGRIDLRRHLASGIDTPIACRFDEFTTDVPENQLLLAAIRRLLRLADVAPATRQLLARQQSRLDEVSPTAVDPDVVLRMRFTRLNRHYEPALRLARIVLQSTSILDSKGTAQASVFLLDMHKVFEEFLEWRLRRHLAGQLEVVGQETDKLDRDGIVTIKPDLLFRRNNMVCFVGDAKYKRTETGTGPESDVYQLLAYLTAFDVAEGVLVYSKDSDAPSRPIRVRNSDKTVWTWPLELRGGASAIDEAVDELATWIADRTTPTARTLIAPQAPSLATSGAHT